MKALFVFLSVLVSNAYSQEIFTINLRMPSNEDMGTPLFVDIDGNGERELCARIFDSRTNSYWLVAWDLTFRRELGRIVNSDRESPFYPADIDGDGRQELITFNWVVWGDRPGFVIFRWENGRFTRTEYTTFYGDGGRVGDIDGDGRDEVILNHLPEGYTSPGGYGPVEIQAVAWDGGGFRLKAKTTFPESHHTMYVGDLNGNGRAEITILRSGYKRPRLSVFGYTHSQDLALIDEWVAPRVYNDNLVRLWGEVLSGNKRRLIVPIPEQYWEGETGPERIQFFGFRLTRLGIEPEPEPLVFKEFQNYKHSGPLPILLEPEWQQMDINGDGFSEAIRIGKGGLLRFVSPVAPAR